MKIKEILIVIGIFILFPIASIVGININNNEIETHSHINKVNIKEIIENNKAKGKEEALLNAQRFLDYEGYNKEMLEEDLKALGYSQKEIKYAIKSVQGL